MFDEAYGLLVAVRRRDRPAADRELEGLRARGLLCAETERRAVTWVLLYWELQDALDLLNDWALPFSCHRNYLVAYFFEVGDAEKLAFMRRMGGFEEREFLADAVRGGNLAAVQRVLPQHRESVRIHTGEWISFERLLEIAEECSPPVWSYLKSIDPAEHMSDPEQLSEHELLYGENEMLSDYSSDEPYQHWW